MIDERELRSCFLPIRNLARLLDEYGSDLRSFEGWAPDGAADKALQRLSAVSHAMNDVQSVSADLCAILGSELNDGADDLLPGCHPRDEFFAQAARQLANANVQLYDLASELVPLARVTTETAELLKASENLLIKCSIEASEPPDEDPRLESAELLCGEIVQAWLRLEPRLLQLLTLGVLLATGTLDRTAQLLAYVFFNTRKLSHETYDGIVVKLRDNYAREDKLFAAQYSWNTIDKARLEGSGERLEGLLRRRNVLAHAANFDGFGSALRSDRHALDRRRAALDLLPTPSAEVERFMAQLMLVVTVQGAALELCRFGLRTLGLRPFMSPPGSAHNRSK